MKPGLIIGAVVVLALMLGGCEFVGARNTLATNFEGIAIHCSRCRLFSLLQKRKCK